MSHRVRSGAWGARPSRTFGSGIELEPLEDRTLRGVVGLHARVGPGGHVSVRFDRGGPNAGLVCMLVDPRRVDGADLARLTRSLQAGA